MKQTISRATPVALALMLAAGILLPTGCSADSVAGGDASVGDGYLAGIVGEAGSQSLAGRGNGGGRGYGGGAAATGRGPGAAVGAAQPQFESAEDLMALIQDIPASPLSPEEQAGLLFMTEEERMARDLYAAFFERWNLPVFESISRSETQHLATLVALADRYGAEAAVSELPPGEYASSDLQTLYDSLLAQGSTSIAGALAVAAEVEEIDIVDLERFIAASDNDDLRIIYQNLTKGSRNHLRSFVAQLERLDETYTAQHLDTAYFERILQIIRETAPITDPDYTM